MSKLDVGEVRDAVGFSLVEQGAQGREGKKSLPYIVEKGACPIDPIEFSRARMKGR